MMASGHTPVRTALLLGLLFAPTGCAQPVQNPAPALAPTARAPGPPPAPASVPIAAPANFPGSDEKPVVFNDPPAAPDTPLCGRQAQERNAIGAALQGERVAASGICARFACYDPLTATYFGADGYRHVCR